MQVNGPAKITFRFRHHQIGIDIQAQIDDGAWHDVELIPARQFKTIEEQWAFPLQYMRAIQQRGFDVHQVQ